VVLAPIVTEEGSAPPADDVFTVDHYEVLRVSPRADDDTIERVYRTLANRFHPDNRATGDHEAYLRVTEAYETLSDAARRAEYNAFREQNRGSARFRLQAREFFDGVRGEQNRRLAMLCLLYRQRISANESPGRSMLDLELATGCTREELSSALWYLCEKNWVRLGDRSEYSITADGFDVVESKLEERSEFRAFANVRYYNPPEPVIYSPAVVEVHEHGDGQNPSLHNLFHAVNGHRKLLPEALPARAPAEPRTEPAAFAPPPPRAPEPAVVEASPRAAEPSRHDNLSAGDIIVAAVVTLIGRRLTR
jgi:curved DNA-binding protein CbpA